jgi:N-methylhydantoinase A
VNPAHEARVKAIVQRRLPDAFVTASHELSGEYREFERCSTAAANAYIGPRVREYVRGIDAHIAAEGFRGKFLLVQSTGGLYESKQAEEQCVRMLESGPAAGVIGAGALCRALGLENAVAFDMGGTTAKAGVIHRGEALTRASALVGGYAQALPVQIPMIDISEVGTGGGSIAAVDATGALRVGPQSAGAEPGPACYARGGLRPTVTDADVTLGMIDPAAFAGGTIALKPNLSKAALATAVGDPLGMSPETAAYAVHEMVCENMASAARVHAVERGEIVSEHTLIAFGGAAPLHAARVAEKLGVPRVLVPPNAGVGSAVGFLVAPISYELVKSRHMRLDNFDFAGASALLAEMSRDARALVEPGARGAPATERRLAYMRYVGQGHEITVPLPVRDLIEDDAAALRETFEREYSVLFRRPIPGAAIEALSWSVLISTKAERPAAINGAPEKRAPSPDGSRSFFDGRAGKSIDVPLYRRERMEAGVRVPGPAIIAEDETSTFVTASFDARIDVAGCIVMERRTNA